MRPSCARRQVRGGGCCAGLGWGAAAAERGVAAACSAVNSFPVPACLPYSLASCLPSSLPSAVATATTTRLPFPSPPPGARLLMCPANSPACLPPALPPSPRCCPRPRPRQAGQAAPPDQLAVPLRQAEGAGAAGGAGHRGQDQGRDAPQVRLVARGLAIQSAGQRVCTMRCALLAHGMPCNATERRAVCDIIPVEASCNAIRAVTSCIRADVQQTLPHPSTQRAEAGRVCEAVVQLPHTGCVKIPSLPHLVCGYGGRQQQLGTQNPWGCWLLIAALLPRILAIKTTLVGFTT